MTFTLLWVEDDPDDVLLGERALMKAGFEQPMIARDGDEAISYMAGEGEFADRARFPLPSLVLLDLKLPRKSGLEVLRWIRGHEGLKRIPVIMLTSSQERHDIDRAYDSGANAYLVKPVEMRAFSEVVLGLHHFWVMLNTRPEALPQQSPTS
ncbi:MAG: response regulator [Planctomycetota bacterium]|nr:MAG: response regulator [Planctomycetota bacterium]